MLSSVAGELEFIEELRVGTVDAGAGPLGQFRRVDRGGAGHQHRGRQRRFPLPHGPLALTPDTAPWVKVSPLAVRQRHRGGAPNLWSTTDDSDVLFFARPDDLLARAGDPGYRRNAFNADVAPALNITAGEALAAPTLNSARPP